MDSIDLELIRLLEQDALGSSAKIAKRLNTSPSTVRRRFRALVQNDTVRIVALVNPDKVAPQLRALIGLHVLPNKIESVMHKIYENYQVTWVATTTGRFDIMFIARFGNPAELNKFIQAKLAEVEGVTGSETFVCLQWLNWGHYPGKWETARVV